MTNYFYISDIHFGYQTDTTIVVTDQEIRAYYDAHKKFYKQQESRDIEYVVFEVKPSEADIQATSDNFNKLYEEFGTTDNVKSFLAKNSDRVLSNYWYKAGELATINSDINNYVFDKPEGVSPVLGENDAVSIRLFFSTIKFEPSKKVATAPPKRSGPKSPLRMRNHSNVWGPRKLPSLCWNS